MKAWITKYALTKGIIESDGDEDGTSFESHDGKYRIHGYARNYFLSKTVAKAYAEEMRKAKIASLQKQIAKLEKLEF